MDTDRLQTVIHRIAEPSRRTLLSLAAAVGLASVIDRTDANARKKRRKKKKCKGGQKKCGKRCIARDACCSCPAGTFCQHAGCFVGCSGSTPDACLIGGSCGAGCACRTTTAGPNVCAAEITCMSAQPCDDDGDCPTGDVCIASGCCTAFGKPRVCHSPCIAS